MKYLSLTPSEPELGDSLLLRVAANIRGELNTAVAAADDDDDDDDPPNSEEQRASWESSLSEVEPKYTLAS